MKLSVKVDNKTFERASKLLEGIPGGVEKATVSALNRALQEGRTAGVREVTNIYAIKAKDVRGAIELRAANKGDIEAEMFVSGTNLSLKRFAIRPNSDTTGAKRRQVRVARKKGRFETLDKGFVWRGHAFRREGNKRLPIEKQFGPSIPAMFGNDNVVDKVEDTMVKAVDKRLEHETNRILNKY